MKCQNKSCDEPAEFETFAKRSKDAKPVMTRYCFEHWDDAMDRVNNLDDLRLALVREISR